MSLFSFVRWSLQAVFKYRTMLLLALLHILIGVGAVAYTQNLVSFESVGGTEAILNQTDVFLIAFGGPPLSSKSITALLFWFLPQLLFFYAYGSHASDEFFSRGDYILMRIASRSRWWLGKILTSIALVGGYTISYFGLVLLVALYFAGWEESTAILLENPSINSAAIFWQSAILFSSTLVSLSILQMFLSIFLTRAYYGFAAVSALVLFSWLLGFDNPTLVPWLPGSQSILSRHSVFESTVPNFTLIWSILYNVISISIVSYIGLLYIRRIDIVQKS